MKSTLSSNGSNVLLPNALSERYDREFLRIGISLNFRAVSADLHDCLIRRRPVLKSVATAQATIPENCKPYLGLPGFEIGQILRDDFRTMRQNPLLDYFRTFRQNNCPDTACTLFASCHGDCPAASYIFHGDCDTPDPRCRMSSRIIRYLRGLCT